MNNLYGWAMNEYLSYGRFEWLENIDDMLSKYCKEIGDKYEIKVNKTKR